MNNQRTKWVSRPNVSHRTERPSVCYEIVEVGERGGVHRVVARTPRKQWQKKDTFDEQHARLLAASKDLLNACELGDSVGNGGPFLLNYAAEFLDNYLPITADELRRKAKAELLAIRKAKGESSD